MPPDPLQMLTLDEAAALLGVHRRTVDRMIKGGDLAVFRWRNTIRVYHAELNRFVQAHTTRAPRKQPRQQRSREPLETQAPATETTEPSEPTPPDQPTATTRSIVILEDDENVRHFLVFALTVEGYAVRPCASYDELLQICTQTPVDLVIADGWGDSTAVLEPAEREAIMDLARWCPVIMTTGRDWAERADPAELGLVAIFRKPFELDQLLATVHSLES